MAAAFLKQGVLAPVTAVGGRIGEVLRAVDLDGELEIGAKQVDLHFALAVERDREFGIEPEQAGGFRQGFEAVGVLGDDAAPGNGHSEEEGVEERVVETFPDEFASRDDDPCFVFRDGDEFGGRLAQRFPAHATLENDQVRGVRTDQICQSGDMFGALSEDQRCAAIRIGLGYRAEAGGADDDMMGEWPGLRLLFRIHAVADLARVSAFASESCPVTTRAEFGRGPELGLDHGSRTRWLDDLKGGYSPSGLYGA